MDYKSKPSLDSVIKYEKRRITDSAEREIY